MPESRPLPTVYHAASSFSCGGGREAGRLGGSLWDATLCPADLNALGIYIY